MSAMLDRGGVKLWAAQSIEIKDRDPEKIELRMTPPFSLHGKIVFDAPETVPVPGDDLPNVIVEYRAGEFGGDKTCPERPIGNPDGKGNLAIQIYPGAHHVDLLEPPPARFYLDSIRLGGEDALAADVSILSDGQPLIVTYKFGGGSVQGTIDACGSGRVLLIPQDPVLRRHEFLRETNCGPNGQFEFTAVRPGEYYGFAVSADSSARWYTALMDGPLLSRASKLTVRHNEHTSADIRLTRW